MKLESYPLDLVFNAHLMGLLVSLRLCGGRVISATVRHADRHVAETCAVVVIRGAFYGYRLCLN